VDKAVPRVAARAMAINKALRVVKGHEARRRKEEVTARHKARLQVASARSAEAWVPAHVGLAMVQVWGQDAARGASQSSPADETQYKRTRGAGRKGMVAVDAEAADRELTCLLQQAQELSDRLTRLKRAWGRVTESHGARGGQPKWLLLSDERQSREHRGTCEDYFGRGSLVSVRG